MDNLVLYATISLLSFLASQTSHGQVAEKPLQVDIGIYMSSYPQLEFALLPTNNIEVSISGYLENETSSIVDIFDNVFGSLGVHWLARRSSHLQLRAGVNLLVDRIRYSHSTFLGPTIGFEHRISDKARIWAQFSLEFGLANEGVFMRNSGAGLRYRIKS